MQSELNLIKPVLARKSDDLDKLERSSNKEIRELQARNQELALKVSELKDDHDRAKGRATNEFEEQRKIYDLKLKQLEERIRSLDEQNAQKDKTIATLKNSIEVKER